MGNLLRWLARRHAFFVVFSVVLLGLFEFLMCALVSTIDVNSVVAEVLKSMPPAFRGLFGNEFMGGLTARSVLAFGWNHPIVQALGTALAIVLGARAIAGEIENGTLEMVLSQPLSRAGYFIAHVVFALLALVVLSLAAMLGTLIGQSAFALEKFDVHLLVELAGNYFLLQGSWFAITLVLSGFGRESGRVATIAFLLALVSYLVVAIGSLWQPLAFLVPYAPHGYYSPQSILVEGNLSTASMLVLLLIMLAGLGFAGWRFQRRDIP